MVDMENRIKITLEAFNNTKKAFNEVINQANTIKDVYSNASSKVKKEMRELQVMPKEAVKIRNVKEQLGLSKEQLLLAQKGINTDISRTDSSKGFFKVISMNMPTYKDWVQQGSIGATKAGKLASGVRQATHGLRGFRMEMLGVMFFGMGMQRMFMDLLQPALEASGLFELLSATLELVFLPIALVLVDALLPILEWFMNLSDETKMLIGQFVLIGAGIGAFLFIVGALALGIGSIIQAFGGVLNIIEKIFPEPFGDAAAAMFGFGVVSTGVAGSFKLWNFIEPIISGIWSKIGEIPFIQKLLEGLGVTVEEGQSPFDALKQTVSNFATNLLSSVGLSSDEITSFKTKIGDLWTSGQSWLEQLKVKFKELWVKIKDIDLNDFISKMSDLALKATEELIPAFITLIDKLKEIWKYIKPVWDAFKGIVDASNSLTRGGETYTRGVGLNPENVSTTWINTLLGILNPLRGIVPYQHGGLVTKPTIALLGESGPEMVTPIGQSGFENTSFSPVYNINATISSDIDIRSLAEKLNAFLTQDYRRLTYR